VSFWLLQFVRLHWHPRLGVVLLVGFAAGVVAAFYVVGVTLAPELSARRMLLPVAVIVFMSGGLQYVAVRRLGRSPWAFSLAYALPFLLWTLLFVGDVVPLALWGLTTTLALAVSVLAGYLWARRKLPGM
jgi:hypothetical protein